MKAQDIEKLEKMVEEAEGKIEYYKKRKSNGNYVEPKLQAWYATRSTLQEVMKILKPHLLASEGENEQDRVNMVNYSKYLQQQVADLQSKLSSTTKRMEAAEAVIEFGPPSFDAHTEMKEIKEYTKAYQSWQSLKSNEPIDKGDEYDNIQAGNSDPIEPTMSQEEDELWLSAIKTIYGVSIENEDDKDILIQELNHHYTINKKV